jgi:hypothetical protein
VGKIDGALGSLKDSLASGKLSAGLGESLGGGLSGLNTSLSGLGDKLKGSLDNMKSGPQNMFAAMKDSFPNLKGGEINILGGGKADTKSPTELAANAYDSAKAEYDAAEEEWFNAKRDYSYSKSDEDYERIGKAEADKAAAQQKMTKASKAFMASVPGAGALADAAGNIGDKISASAGGIAKDLSASFDKLKGGGIEALPGGISALAATVNNKIPGGSNPLNNIKNSLTAVSGVADKVKGLTSGGSSDLASSLADPKKFAGGLISGASSKLEGLMGTKVGALAGDKALGESAAKGMMAQLQSSMDAMAGSNSELKPPVIASGTFDATSITASLGKLMGDSRIPIPSFDSLPPPDPNAAPKPKNEAEAKAYEAVEEAEYRVRNAKLNISLTEKTSKSWPEQQRLEALEKARDGLAEEQDKLQKARVAYDAVINSTST